MHIWLNGTYGVGKTSVAEKIQEKLTKEKTEILDSDVVYKEFNQKYPFIGGGTLPQNNMRFIEYFKSKVEEKMKYSNNNLIIVMALTQKESKNELVDNFIEKNKQIQHVILTANVETIKLRIERDEKERDVSVAIGYLNLNINFLNANYENTIRIDTENKTIDEEAEEIIELLKIQ